VVLVCQRCPPSTFNGVLDPDFAPRSPLFLFDKNRGFVTPDGNVTMTEAKQIGFLIAVGLYFRAEHIVGSDLSSSVAGAICGLLSGCMRHI
jgi:hypothetical protein